MEEDKVIPEVVPVVDNSNDDLIQKFDEVIELLTPTEETTEIIPTETIDHTDTLQNIVELLEQQNALLTAISEGSATILVYGLIVVPLIVIVSMLWWFFKQFLYNY